MQEDDEKLNIDLTENKNASLSTKLGNFDFNVSTTENNGTVEKSGSVSYSKEAKDVSISANLETAGNEFGYNTEIGVKHGFDNGINANATLFHSKDDTSLTVGVNKKFLINPDNINNLENQDKIRKEELVETGERFNLQTKMGYSEEQNGLYTQNSLMYRIDNSNFLNTEYTQNNANREISATADLQKIKLEYKNSETKEEFSKTTANAFNVMTKGAKNQYSFGLNNSKTRIGGENPETNRNLNLEAGAKLNRTEYGEFNSGLNGEAKTGLTLNRGKVSGYKVDLDWAYNRYGTERNSTTDYLVRTSVNFGKENDTKNFSAALGGDYRINNCNTIFEAGAKYSSESAPDIKNKSFSTNLGVYQNLGRNFGDTTIFTQLETGKKWEKTSGGKNSLKYAQVSFGSDAKVAERLSLNTRMTYDTGRKWSGEIGVRYSF